MASVQRRKPECPLCRASFAPDVPLEVNGELRDLVALLSTLHTVEQADGWQELAATKGKNDFSGQGSCDAKSDDSDGSVALVPLAPPLHCDLDSVRGGEGDLLSLEPPMWIPDSHTGSCTSCNQVFRPFSRGRHHCRLCGNIFCSMCCGHRLMLPPKFRIPEPQRTCTECAALLQPLQPFLAGTISRAVQPAVRDVMDSSCPRSWVNPPLGTGGLPADIYKAANIAAAFRRVGALSAERCIPTAVLRGAAGFAILSIAKVGLGWSAGVGSGLVIARREDDSWGPPSALAACSAGWGLQVGGGLTDHLIVLRSPAAVAAFCGSFAAGVSGGVSFAAGPLGRQADAGMTVGPRGAALCYTYSLSRGVFAGLAIEGTLVTTREAANLAFYGRPHSARTLLATTDVTPPTAASALYQALDELLTWAEALPSSPGFLTARGISARDARASDLAATQSTREPSSFDQSHRSASQQAQHAAAQSPSAHELHIAHQFDQGEPWDFRDESPTLNSPPRADASEALGQSSPPVSPTVPPVSRSASPSLSASQSDEAPDGIHMMQGSFYHGLHPGNGLTEEEGTDQSEDDQDSLPPAPTFVAVPSAALPIAAHSSSHMESFRRGSDDNTAFVGGSNEYSLSIVGSDDESDSLSERGRIVLYAE